MLYICVSATAPYLLSWSLHAATHRRGKLYTNAGHYAQRAKLDANSTLHMLILALLILIGWMGDSFVCQQLIHFPGSSGNAHCGEQVRNQLQNVLIGSNDKYRYVMLFSRRFFPNQHTNNNNTKLNLTVKRVIPQNQGLFNFGKLKNKISLIDLF